MSDVENKTQWCSKNPEGLVLDIRVSPKCSKAGVVGEYGGQLKITLCSAPEDGAANDELIRFLAKKIGISRSHVVLHSGFKSRSKKVFLIGSDFSVEKVRGALLPV